MGERRLGRGEWTILDLPDGWQLRVRFDTPLSLMMPRYLRRNVMYMAIGPITGMALFAYLAWAADLPLDAVVILSPLAVLASLAMTLIMWPFRFGRSGGYRVLEDGTVDRNYYRLRYFDANRTITIAVRDGALDVRGGVFAPHHLASLRIEEVYDSFPGRVGLSFSGSVVKHEEVVGWPGVPRRLAEEIRSALIERVGEPSGAATPGR